MLFGLLSIPPDPSPPSSDAPEQIPRPDFEPLARAWRVSLIASLAAYIVLQVLWILVTPVHQQSLGDSLPGSNQKLVTIGAGPDEAEHYLYILSITDSGRLPVAGPAWRKEASEYVSHEAQQPPLFYLAAACIAKLFGGLGERAVWYALRAFEAICGAIVIVMLARAALAAFPNNPLVCLATAPFVALLPIFGYMSGTLSNVPLEMIFTSFIWLRMLEALKGLRPIDTGFGLQIGVAFGLSLLTRVTCVLWAPTFAALFMVCYLRSSPPERRRVLTAAAVCCAVLAAIALPWYVHMKETYGSFLFRSDYRPLLSGITLPQYLANPDQGIHPANSDMTVHIGFRSILLWVTSSSWSPMWLAQFSLPGQPNAVGVYQALFLLADVFALMLLLRNWSANRNAEASQRDPAIRALLWACGLGVTLSVLMVLQQLFWVDVIILTYAGRYTVSVLAASAVIWLFALSTLTNRSLGSGIGGAIVVGVAALALDLCFVGLLYQFYSSQGAYAT